MSGIARKLMGVTKGPGDTNPNAWSLNSVTLQGFGRFGVAEQETNPESIFFKSDGTRMYILGDTGDDVNEYELTTAWEVGTASFVRSFSITAQEVSPTGMFFRPDGTKMYILGNAGDDVNEYNLSSAWDISTASYLQNFSVAGQDTSPTGVFFKPDGAKMYIVGIAGRNVYEYNLSLAWNISTATIAQIFSVGAQEMAPEDVFFKPDGTKMYVIGSTGDNVYEYDLSSAWNISTAAFLQSFSVSIQEPTPQSVFFKEDGTRMYITGVSTDAVYSYTLSTPWNVSTATFDFPPQSYFNVEAQEITPQDLFFKPDGTKMYIVGNSSDRVHEYDLSAAWNVSTASYVQGFLLTAQETNPTGMYFSPDGIRMYIVGTVGDDINQYSLSSAWDISTASFVRLFSVATREAGPQAVFFKPDGTKMYVIGNTSDMIHEYNLSLAWDISTSSFLQNFSVQTQETAPNGMFFKPDGTKMYVVGSVSDSVHEYNISSAWDISTASYVQNFSVSVVEGTPTGVFFKPDGTEMFMIGNISDAVWQYDLI